MAWPSGVTGSSVTGVNTKPAAGLPEDMALGFLPCCARIRVRDPLSTGKTMSPAGWSTDDSGKDFSRCPPWFLERGSRCIVVLRNHKIEAKQNPTTRNLICVNFFNVQIFATLGRMVCRQNLFPVLFGKADFTRPELSHSPKRLPKNLSRPRLPVSLPLGNPVFMGFVQGRQNAGQVVSGIFIGLPRP